MRFKIKDWANSYYCFEVGDGSCYTVHLTPCEHGGIYVIEGNVKNNSLWIWFKGEEVQDCEIRHLCGNDNDYTKRAILKIMWFHHSERMKHA